MSGLKPNEWQSWDSQNLEKQQGVAEGNVNILLNKLWELGLDRSIHDSFKNRLSKWKVSPTGFMQKASTRMIFDLQADLSALEFFISQRGIEFLSEINFDIPVFPQIQGMMHQGVESIDSFPSFPQMTLDAIKAIKTDGAEPPAKEMQKAQDYFADRAAASMNATLT